MNKMKMVVMVALMVVMGGVSTSIAEPVISGSADEMGRTVKVGWKWQLGKEHRQKVPASFAHGVQPNFVALGGAPLDKPPMYKTKGFWITLTAIVAVVMIGDNNDWSFSSDSNDKSTSTSDGRSLSIDIASGAEVGDDINISNLTIYNFSSPAPEESSSSE